MAGLLVVSSHSVFAQQAEPEIERPEPPARDDFESDKNNDGVPDGWYNLRDARIVTEGGIAGPKFVKFESVHAGRPARLSRAFGVDGRKYEAIILGLWVRVDQIQAGERTGDEPGLIVDFLGDKLRQVSRGSLGPWTVKNLGAASHWTRVSKRIPVPPGTRDAIMSVGLLGATGVLDIDGLTVTLVPVGGAETTNLVKNADFEEGDPEPAGWIVDNGGHRSFPGFQSNSALELTRAGSRCMTGLAVPVEGFEALSVSVRSRGQGLRSSGGAAAAFFFLGENGIPLPDFETGVRALRWSGTFDWSQDRAIVPVPRGAVRAVLQIEKSDSLGSLKLDDLEVTCSPDASSGKWTPYHAEEETRSWLEVSACSGIEPKSALDFSFLLDGPAGKHGNVTVKDGRFHFARGGNRARFFGTQLIAPTAFLEPAKADALADRIARLGVNLVRLGDLDNPLGPDRSLFDDTRDDTKQFDPNALARLDHLIAALKSRGIYVALELQSARRFRVDDGVAMPGALAPGGGAAAIIDPTIVKLSDASSRALLGHVGKETHIALRNDPALAWVTLAGETSLFDENPAALPGDYAKAYRDLAAQSTHGTGRRFWQALETARWKGLVDLLRKDGFKAPLAGVSHWRREREFCEAQAAPGLDLIDDRIYWLAPTWISPRWRSMLRIPESLTADANRKRRTDRPYVVGQWCDYTHGVWAYPYEAAEQLLAADTARAEDWDALVRRGVFIYPEPWGNSAPGTAGGEDIFQVPEVANAAPHVFALWPHAASMMLRGPEPVEESEAARERAKTRPRSKGETVPAAPRQPTRSHRTQISGWAPDRGRLVVETPFTQGVAGWPGDESATFEHLSIDVENSYGVVVASSAGVEPIARTRRLLVTAIARVTPTGFRWVDEWRRETADPGRPPLLAEPVAAKVTWKRKGTIKAYALDNNGARIGPATVQQTTDGSRLVIDGTVPALHWEMVVE
jgi:hypothetical protein